MLGWETTWFAEPVTRVLRLRYAALRCLDAACLPRAPGEEAAEAVARATGREDVWEAAVKKRSVVLDADAATAEIMAGVAHVLRRRAAEAAELAAGARHRRRGASPPWSPRLAALEAEIAAMPDEACD